MIFIIWKVTNAGGGFNVIWRRSFLEPKITNMLEVNPLLPATSIHLSLPWELCTQYPYGKKNNLHTFPETKSKSTCKWMVGILVSFWDPAYFQVRTVSFRERMRYTRCWSRAVYGFSSIVEVAEPKGYSFTAFKLNETPPKTHKKKGTPILRHPDDEKPNIVTNRNELENNFPKISEH